jgi:hypothetical protein
MLVFGIFDTPTCLVYGIESEASIFKIGQVEILVLCMK